MAFFDRFRKKPPQQAAPLRWHFPLSELLHLLRSQGFSIGVDTQIALQRVIQQFTLPQDLSLLADYLAPLVAQSAEQQAFFKHWFGQWFFVEKALLVDPLEPGASKAKSSSIAPQTQADPSSRTPFAQDNAEKLVLNVAQGSLASQGLSFAVPPVDLEYPAELLRALRQLRFLSETNERRFDLAASLKKLAAQGDLDVPLYGYTRKHSSYLLLVEHNALRNHQAAFIQNLYTTLLSNNVDAALYTYQTDPRLLYSNPGNSPTPLRQLAATHAEAILLYFGGNELWQDSASLEIYPWTEIFRHWERRYWFPPTAPDTWGVLEQVGTQVFPQVLPLSFEGLKTLAQHLAHRDNANWVELRFWAQHLDYDLTEINTQLPLSTIALFFSAPVRTWIAACAVYPELSWALTLELGRLLSSDNSPLYQAEAVRQLLRLDWFREGHIPPALRYQLLQEWISPNQVMRINAHIAGLMRADTRFDALVQLPQFRLQLALHELMGENEASKRQAIAQELQKELAAGQQADFVSLQYLNEADLSPIFFVIPDDLAEHFQRVTGQSFRKTTRDFREKIGNATLEMIFVQGGQFRMGGEEYDDEKPIHTVNVADFYMSKYPVTLAEFAQFIAETGYKTEAEKGDGSYVWDGKDWKKGRGVNWRCGVDGRPRPQGEDQHPVIHVSWNDAQAYCEWLSRKTGKHYQLPSEAQWEYAARGGIQSQGYTYAGSNNLDEVGWYNANSNNSTQPVGLKKPNELGLYDLSGNVWEWCQDEWHSNYEGAPDDGRAWENKGKPGSYRVVRGGSWGDIPVNCRVADRYYYNPGARYSGLGFRVVFVPQLGG
jgi:formylglycine-generating enzyme required for sulfatase activity